MPATIRRSSQNSNVYGAYGIVSSDQIDQFTRPMVASAAGAIAPCCALASTASVTKSVMPRAKDRANYCLDYACLIHTNSPSEPPTTRSQVRRAVLDFKTHDDPVERFETERAVEDLCRVIVTRHLQFDRGDSLDATKIANCCHHPDAQSLAAISWQDEQIGHQSFEPAELKIIVEGEDHISGQSVPRVDHPDATE
jgi:hypothetical protein